MKINFLSPSPGRDRVGGLKVIYQYANKLSAMGYEVCITYIPVFSNSDHFLINYSLGRNLLHYLAKKYTKKYNYKPKWFILDNKIQTYYKLPYFINRSISDSDIVIFVASEVINICKNLPESKGIKVFLIIEYEKYAMANHTMKANFRKIFNNRKIHNIACSIPVKTMLKECKAKEDLYIPNFINFKEFNLDIDINDRKRTYIGFPTREENYKGVQDAVEALKFVKKELPNIKVWSFGKRKLDYFPDWIEFYESPTNKKLRELYNRSKIFVMSSYYEGWGLPGSEAMACGATLVSTRNGGVDSYATDNKTALLSDIKDPKSLANNIIKLLKDDKLRLKLAKEGNKNIKKFNIDNSVFELDKYLNNILHSNKH